MSVVSKRIFRDTCIFASMSWFYWINYQYTRSRPYLCHSVLHRLRQFFAFESPVDIDRHVAVQHHTGYLGGLPGVCLLISEIKRSDARKNWKFNDEKCQFTQLINYLLELCSECSECFELRFYLIAIVTCFSSYFLANFSYLLT